MNVRAYGSAALQKLELAENAVEFFTAQLMDLRTTKKLSVNVEIVPKSSHLLNENHTAITRVLDTDIRRPKEFLIRTRNVGRKKEFVETIAHEMVHVKQLFTGQFRHGVMGEPASWLGKEVNDNEDYWELPWEIEAHGREKGLRLKFEAWEKVQANALN